MSLISDAPVHPAAAGGSWAEVAKLVEEREVVCSDANDDLGEESERTNEGREGPFVCIFHDWTSTPLNPQSFYFF